MATGFCVSVSLVAQGFSLAWNRAPFEALRDQHHADPIFVPIFTAVLGAGGFGLTGTTLATAAAIASAIATTAVVPGVQVR
ncbi:hypothetical protein [Mesorhizobium sp. M1378]|uniref:hypothetical protein n=1 Tax=Mesorhizobium sp. M1378 TaxID=2957092 RepID=UPI003336525D